MTDKPSAAARAWDAAALVLVLGGAALYVIANEGMHDLLGPQARMPTNKSIHFERWLHYRTMSNIGFSLIAGGVAVGITAWYRSRREVAARAALPAAAVIDASPNVPQG